MPTETNPTTHLTARGRIQNIWMRHITRTTTCLDFFHKLLIGVSVGALTVGAYNKSIALNDKEIESITKDIKATETEKIRLSSFRDLKLAQKVLDDKIQSDKQKLARHETHVKNVSTSLLFFYYALAASGTLLGASVGLETLAVKYIPQPETRRSTHTR